MRVAVMGQAAFGEAVLERLRADRLTIAGVAAPEPVDGRVDPLWAAGAAAGVPLVPTVRLKAAEGLARWQELGVDLCVMVFVTDILLDEVFSVPTRGTIQYHPSLLPRHRGQSAMNWSIINGETETGLTVFWPDKGIDTGPVLLQRRCEIGPDDTVGSLYFERLYPMGVEAMAEAVTTVAQGRAPSVEQDHAHATYEPPCREPHGEIRWYEPADRIYARIRGCNPQPGAWTEYEGEKLRIFDCRLTGEHAAGRSGRVLEVDEQGFSVRLNGGVLRVTRVQPPGSTKVPAGEWAARAGLRAGFRFR
ncbi:MAG: methionyl-tRNA formyltransferase [Carbonactinosporaceae bacterium]